LTGTARPLDSRTNALAAARAASDKQAEDVVVLDLRGISTIADFFLICTADNSRHLDALKEHLAAELFRRGSRVEHTEGAAGAPAGKAPGQEPSLRWVLMDCGDLIIHLFDRQSRDFYRLEDLWADAPRLPLDLNDTGRRAGRSARGAAS
jgi:ribosome-associated protein